MKVNDILGQRGTTFSQICSHRFNNINDLDIAPRRQLSKISLTETEIEQDGKRFLLRSAVP